MRPKVKVSQTSRPKKYRPEQSPGPVVTPFLVSGEHVPDATANGIHHRTLFTGEGQAVSFGLNDAEQPDTAANQTQDFQNNSSTICFGDFPF